MKVLFFISSLSLANGGPSRSVPLLAKGLSESGVDLTLMTYQSNDMNTHSLADTNVKLKALNGSEKKSDIEHYIVNEGFELIQLQSIWDLSYHLIAGIAQRHRIPYIVTPRGMLEPWSLSQKAIKKMLALKLYQKRDLDKSACIYTTAITEANNVLKLNIKAPCSIIPNGIETKSYPCRKDIGCVKKQILFLSRIHVKKGIELLIDAWKDLYFDYPEWKVIIVGNGEAEYIMELKKRVIAYGLKDCIEITPPVFGNDKIELYQSSSLFVLPSYSENFGMAIAEALSCGVPVITTDNTPWQVLNENNSGWCIPLSVEKLRETLREAMDLSPQTLFQMGQNGSSLITDRFGYRSIAAKTVQLYQWILSGNNKPVFITEKDYGK